MFKEENIFNEYAEKTLEERRKEYDIERKKDRVMRIITIIFLALNLLIMIFLGLNEVRKKERADRNQILYEEAIKPYIQQPDSGK